jgi:hypothetical protein
MKQFYAVSDFHIAVNLSYCMFLHIYISVPLHVSSGIECSPALAEISDSIIVLVYWVVRSRLRAGTAHRVGV